MNEGQAAQTTVADTPWFSGMDYSAAGFTKPAEGQPDELKGYLENRGLTGKTPAEVALHAIKAHRAAEQHIGVSPDRLIRLPKDQTDAAGIAEMRAKLGVPADGKYDFANVKFSDGSPLTDEFTAVLSKALANANVSKDNAASVAQDLVKHMEASDVVEANAATQKAALELDELKSSWGAKYNANLAVAQETAKKFGIPPEAVQRLENTPGVGYKALMEFFRAVGEATGEDKFVRAASGSGGTGPMSRDAALATLAQRKQDSVWTTKLLNGDLAAIQEMDMLTRAAQ